MTSVRRRRRRWWVLVFVVAGAVLVASVVPLPGPTAPVTGPLGLVGADAWLHAVGYAALTGAVGFAVADGHSPAVDLGTAAGLPMAYGLAMEVLQVPLPSRAFAVADLLANGVGVAAALLVLVVAAWLGRGPLSST